MRAKKKTTITAASTTQGKGIKNSYIISTVKGVFRSGRKVTAQELNMITGSNDARKQISDLRRDGWPITDMRLEGGRKLYWLIPDDRQGELFQEGGEA